MEKTELYLICTGRVVTATFDKELAYIAVTAYEEGFVQVIKLEDFPDQVRQGLSRWMLKTLDWDDPNAETYLWKISPVEKPYPFKTSKDCEIDGSIMFVLVWAKTREEAEIEANRLIAKHRNEAKIRSLLDDLYTVFPDEEG